MTANSWPTTRPSLMLRIQDPNAHEAWETFVRIYVPLIHRYCRRRGLQDADALDVAQEVLGQVRHFEYDPDRGLFRGWLASVTRHNIERFRTKAIRSTRGVQSSEGDWVLDHAVHDGMDWDWERLFNARVLETAMERIRGEFDDLKWRAFLAVAFEQVESEGGTRWVWLEKPPIGHAQAVAAAFDRRVEWIYKVKSEVTQRLKAEVLDIAGDIALFG
jgi:RNA polymerase sigma-70 factor, ECF subfamily